MCCFALCWVASGTVPLFVGAPLPSPPPTEPALPLGRQRSLGRQIGATAACSCPPLPRYLLAAWLEGPPDVGPRAGGPAPPQSPPVGNDSTPRRPLLPAAGLLPTDDSSGVLHDAVSVLPFLLAAACGALSSANPPLGHLHLDLLPRKPLRRTPSPANAGASS